MTETEQTSTFELIVCSNKGEDTTSTVNGVAQAQTRIQEAMQPGNHMIRLDLNGTKWQRWDRVGTQWSEVPTDTMEVLGPIREITFKQA